MLYSVTSSRQSGTRSQIVRIPTAALALTAIHFLCVEAEKDAWRGSGLVFLLLALTRPEGVLVYVVSPGWTAHRRGWGEHVLRHQPRVIFWYNSAGSREPHYLSDRELADDPVFRFFYRAERTPLPARCRKKSCAWRRTQPSFSGT